MLTRGRGHGKHLATSRLGYHGPGPNSERVTTAPDTDNKHVVKPAPKTHAHSPRREQKEREKRNLIFISNLRGKKNLFLALDAKREMCRIWQISPTLKPTIQLLFIQIQAWDCFQQCLPFATAEVKRPLHVVPAVCLFSHCPPPDRQRDRVPRKGWLRRGRKMRVLFFCPFRGWNDERCSQGKLSDKTKTSWHVWSLERMSHGIKGARPSQCHH